MTDLQIFALAAGAQTVVILIGIAGGVLYNNSRITDLKDLINKRIDDLRAEMNRHSDALRAEIGKRFDDLRDLLKSEVKRLEERIDHTRITSR